MLDKFGIDYVDLFLESKVVDYCFEQHYGKVTAWLEGVVDWGKVLVEITHKPYVERLEHVEENISAKV